MQVTSKEKTTIVQYLRGRATVKITTDEIMELTRDKCIEKNCTVVNLSIQEHAKDAR